MTITLHWWMASLAVFLLALYLAITDRGGYYGRGDLGAILFIISIVLFVGHFI